MASATKYNTYPKYKPSGIDWLGDIPEGWEVKKLKYTVKELVGGGTPDTGNDQNWTDGERGTPWVNIADMTNTFIIQETEKKVTPEGLMEKNLRILPKKTLLYSMYASLGKVALLDIEAVTNQAILGVVEDKHKAISDFIKWWLISIEPHLSFFSSSSTQNNLNEFKVKNMPVFLPSLLQQRAIADFLDRETENIEDVIEKKQKLIELLLEKRQALIAHAVIKGLDPKAKMKPSGIDWLGDIPEGWEVKRLRFVSNYVKTGSTLDSEKQEYFEFGNIPWFTPGDFSEKIDLNDTMRKITPKAVIDGEARLFKKDSILLVGIGATLGKIGFSKTEFSANQQINVIYINNQNVPRFYAYYLMAIAEIVTSTSNASTLGILNQEKTKQILCVVPSKQEQIKIVDYIDKQWVTFENVIKKVESQIEKLQEFRQALISNVITGKVKVN